MIHDDHLFKKVNKNISLHWVINLKENKIKILQTAYEESSHWNKEKIYYYITNRY
jgi:hypothetical protein